MSYIENTWLAYAFDRQPAPDRVEAGLARVGAHYSKLVREPPVARSRAEGAIGVALWHRDDERLRWPLWVEDALVVAATNAPTGVERVIGAHEPGAGAASRLAAALSADPERLAELNPPFLLSVLDPPARTLTIVNDFLAAARLYEMRVSDGWLWSNRLGALPLFAGMRPQADPESWAVHAATGWFLGARTPFRGIAKVPAGSSIRAVAGAGGARVERRRTGAVRRLVEPRDVPLERSATEAAEHAIQLARAVARLWAIEPVVNLSGGRDSRITAAGAIAAGVDAKFRTLDIEPGEADLVAELLSLAPGGPRHEVALSGSAARRRDGLRRRLRHSMLVHDGAFNPMALVRPAPPLPQRVSPKPLLTGHGGELAHAFYYTRESLPRLARGGDSELVGRLERSARKKHGAASEHAYGAYRDEIARTLAEGRSHGVEGPSLLDYFYLAQRLPFRAGLGSRNDRYSACATPGFVRGAFDLAPDARVHAALGAAVIARLVPQWRDRPFFHGGTGPMRELTRRRIWEVPQHARALGRMLEGDSLWGECFDPTRVRSMWHETRAGGGHASYESVFARIAARVGFEEHLERLGERATADGAGT